MKRSKAAKVLEHLDEAVLLAGKRRLGAQDKKNLTSMSIRSLMQQDRLIVSVTISAAWTQMPSWLSCKFCFVDRLSIYCLYYMQLLCNDNGTPWLTHILLRGPSPGLAIANTQVWRIDKAPTIASARYTPMCTISTAENLNETCAPLLWSKPHFLTK